MITENINFRGAGKLPVHGVIWTPDDKRVEQVLHVIHGMTEYTGRYKELATYFVFWKFDRMTIEILPTENFMNARKSLIL